MLFVVLQNLVISRVQASEKMGRLRRGNQIVVAFISNMAY